ncbi:NAD-dependent succinate-semialdehyde dehydrogenase [Mesorhizobium abyssinicae]|uniref:NAD-dependent succinate-semialdehyde dehydrogenase n=1 Tax=Mesorhizobium abyssinicae TaxID=1209958 RepID=UPI0033998F5E
MTAWQNTLLFIDGSWRAGAAGETIPVLNPANERQIGTVAKATNVDLDEALAAVARGFAAWRRVSAWDRAVIMRKAACLLRERVDEIAVTMVHENGKPLAQAEGETLLGADIIDWFANEGLRAYGQIIPPRAPDVVQMTFKVPVGPVAAFTPWNFPINQAIRKIAAALAAGCAIIIKGPEETPASVAALVACFADSGVPAGVLNLVFGTPSDISQYLVPHPVIRKVSFTGSTAVGKHLAALAGAHMKRITMELGGHAPVIVAADVNLDSTVQQIATHKFRNAGQTCVSPTRFLVEGAMAEKFTSRFVDFARKLKVGSGLERETDMGPLANERRIPALEALISDALAKGATLATGGKRIGNAGWFFEPTVLIDVPIETRIMNEEPFGPIAVINRFETIDAAISEANRLSYGLAAYAYTNNPSISARLRAEVESGMITINHLGFALPEVPFGGIKDSGFGTEGGSEAIEAYLESRFVTQKS